MRAAIGIDLGGTAIKGGMVNAGGEILARAQVNTGAREGPDAIVRRVAGLIDQLKDAGPGRPAGVGVGSPGPLDPSSGVIYMMPNLPGWENYPLRKAVEEASGLPTKLENDANCAVLAEHWRGAGRGARTVVLLTLGTGIGGGILFDGKLVNGATMSAGEVGHVVIQHGGRKCGCGNHGCLETFCGAAGIVRRAREELERPGAVSTLRETAGDRGDGLTPAAIAKAASEGDGIALAVLRETGRLLGIGVVNLVNLFAPDVVILGGGVAEAGEVLFRAVRDEVRRRALPPSNERVRIVAAELGNAAGVIGAAGLILDRRPPA